MKGFIDTLVRDALVEQIQIEREEKGKDRTNSLYCLLPCIPGCRFEFLPAVR